MKPPPENVVPMTTKTGVIRDTGEVFDYLTPAKQGRRRKGRRKVYALTDLESLKRLQLSAQEWSVLHVVMAAVNPETNQAAIGVNQIAEELDILAPAVSRVMKTLRERRVIETLRQGVHRVNSHIMFRGSNQDWDDATDIEREPLWRR